jgi:multiple sugar transport system substrate-binding protein
MQKLYADVTSLYRLDQIVTDGSGKQSFGQLPAESAALLIGLVIVWILIGAYALWDWSKRKNLKNH